MKHAPIQEPVREPAGERNSLGFMIHSINNRQRSAVGKASTVHPGQSLHISRTVEGWNASCNLLCLPCLLTFACLTRSCHRRAAGPEHNQHIVSEVHCTCALSEEPSPHLRTGTSERLLQGLSYFIALSQRSQHENRHSSVSLLLYRRNIPAVSGETHSKNRRM